MGRLAHLECVLRSAGVSLESDFIQPKRLLPTTLSLAFDLTHNAFFHEAS